MPFYEYQCAACGHHHEELQKVADRPLRKCPACGRARLRRLVSAPVFRLKGGGWYETDFKNDKDGKRNLAGEKEAAPEAPTTAAGDDKLKPDAAKTAAKDPGETKKAASSAGEAPSRKRRAQAPRKIVRRRPRR